MIYWRIFAKPIARPRSPSGIRKLDNETAAASGMTSGTMVDLMEIWSELVGGFAGDGVDGDGDASGVWAPTPMVVWTDIWSGAGEGPGAAWALLPIPSSIQLWWWIPAGE